MDLKLKRQRHAQMLIEREKRKRTYIIDRLIEQSGLKVRLFIYTVGRTTSLDNEFIDYFSTKASLNVDFFNENQEETIDQLRNSKFMGYASLIIIVRRVGKIYRPGIKNLLVAMAKNPFLRYKSKLLLMAYGIDGSDDAWYFVYNSYMDYLEEHQMTTGKFVYPSDLRRKQVEAVSPNLHRFMASVDNMHFRTWGVENTVMVQIFLPDKCHKAQTIDEILYAIFWHPFEGMQQLCSQSYTADLRRRLVQSSTNAELYFYAINPSLAIIINNYYFTGGLGVREGSDRDVAHLIRVLKLAAIPFIVVEDCNYQQMLQLLDYLAKRDFSPIKTLLLFMMSHGDDDDVFYTNDGNQLDMYGDVVKCLQSNPTLRDIPTFIMVNTCRGPTDNEYEEEEEDYESPPDETDLDLNRNTIVLYSVPQGIQSPRSSKWGSPFIQSLCRHFFSSDAMDDVRVLDTKINTDLSQIQYYDGLPKCSDLKVKDPHERYPLMQPPVQALKMLKFLKMMADESIPGSKPCGNKAVSRFLYVCGTVESEDFLHDIRRAWNYFAPELEYENCDVELNEMFYQT